MDFPTHEQLVERIDAFLARHPRLSERAIGVAVTNEPGLIGSIRRGRSPSLNTLNKLADYMTEQDRIASAPEWPLPSASNPSENIRAGVTPGTAEGGSAGQAPGACALPGGPA